MQLCRPDFSVELKLRVFTTVLVAERKKIRQRGYLLGRAPKVAVSAGGVRFALADPIPSPNPLLLKRSLAKPGQDPSLVRPCKAWSRADGHYNALDSRRFWIERRVSEG